MSTEAPTLNRNSTLVRHALSGATMGTRWSATFYADAGLDSGAVSARLQEAVDSVDAQMSTWKPASDLMRFNGAPVGEWVDVPGPLAAVISIAQGIGRETGGAFDVGVGKAVNAWGFGPERTVPDAAAIATVTGVPGMNAGEMLDVDLTANRLRRRRDFSVDLSGIAKGYGVDQLARVLGEEGIESFLVGIDGELRAGGCKPDGSGWSLAIERPHRERREALRAIEMVEAAVATSGDYRHWAQFDGETVAHTIDPRTGRPLTGAVASVTVAADDCVIADAWATALMVLGEVDGPERARTLGLDALFLVRRGDYLVEIPVGAFTAL